MLCGTLGAACLTCKQTQKHKPLKATCTLEQTKVFLQEQQKVPIDLDIQADSDQDYFLTSWQVAQGFKGTLFEKWYPYLGQSAKVCYFTLKRSKYHD